MASRKKNSLVANINRRKRAGKSRSKKRSTVSSAAYADMQRGWPGGKSKRGTNKRTAKTAAKKRSTKKKTAGRARKKKTR